MGKHAFSVCENKGADQLGCDIFCCCTAGFMSHLVRNPKDRFSNDAAHFKRYVIVLFSFTVFHYVNIPCSL